MATFLAIEVVLGIFVGELLLSRALSINTSFLLRGLTNLGAYVIGGFIIGVVSPGRRLVEPAIAGALMLVLTGIVALFVPFRLIGYEGGSFVLACVIAAAFAAAGAYMGEKLTGNAPA